jgi:glutathione S-transferase
MLGVETMKLYCSTNSPYARKVRVVARELGINEKIEPITTDPRDPDSGFWALNPVAKIPALMADNGDMIIDSPVICEYLNERYGQGRLLPSEPRQAWKFRSLVALSDGVLDAGMAVRLEGMRVKSEQSPSWVDRQIATAQRGVHSLADQLDVFGSSVNLVSISFACTLAWLQFRHGHIDWIAGHKKLGPWFNTFEASDSMKKTAPGQPL